MLALNDHRYIASNGSAGWSLDSWNNFIFDLENSDVYRTGIRGIIGTAVGVTDGYLLNNDPLENTLNAALNQIGDPMIFHPQRLTILQVIRILVISSSQLSSPPSISEPETQFDSFLPTAT